MQPNYFVERLRYIDETIDSRLAKLRDQPDVYKKPQAFLRANLRERCEQIFLGYSLGESLGQLAKRFPAVVEAYEAHVQCPGYVPHDFADLDRYLVSLWLVSFGIIFDVDDELWRRLLVCIGNEGRDALYERLVEVRTPGRKAAPGLVHSKIFQPLFEAIAAEGERRAELIRQYLGNWYKALKNAYWIDTHARSDGGFFGYWAVEVAGVVSAFDMDDSSFRGMPYYPRDLVA
ncbi:MAG TPA: PoNe immunity protein domain-containing protein [Burkholderiaceae bacterium]